MFSNSADEIEFVREILLSNLCKVVSDSRLSEFKSFTLEGTFRNPESVTLYSDRNPDLFDDGLLIRFTH